MDNIIPQLLKVGNWIVTALLPVVFVMTAVRFLLTPLYIQIEYRMPRFPADTYGFSLEDRLNYAGISLDYLLNDEGISFLADTNLEDGSPMYNEAELGHMLDVKNVTQAALKVWLGSLAFVLLIGLLQWNNLESRAAFQFAAQRGGWLTVGLIGAILLLIIAAFPFFFTTFHEILFDPGTWTFRFSDTLIRLFPIRFWQDSFLWISGLAIAQALWVISLVKPK